MADNMISKELCQKIINCGLENGADFVDIFAEKTLDNKILMSKNVIKNIYSKEDFGVGIRLIQDDFQTYGYTNIISEESLIKLTKQLSQSISAKQKITARDLTDFNFKKNTHAIISFDSIKKSQKVDFLRQISKKTYEKSNLINKIDINLNEYSQEVLIANSNGLYAHDNRNRARVFQNVILSKDNVIDYAHHSKGASQGYEFFDNININDFAEKNIKKAIDKLGAINCPSGLMPVVIANGRGGVIFHEACGHGLEATSVAKKTSVFTDKIGEQIASPILSACDDGSIKNYWGSLNIDDEGTPTQKNILIENGILKSYLIDNFNGKKMGMSSTGSARKENYKFIPTSRMNNTFIMNGSSKANDIIANTEYGLYATDIGGGQVNTTTGEFNFATNGFLIENGKITTPVKGAKLIGKGQEVIKDIDMIADDLKFGEGICGSISGGVPTTIGQPTIRVSKMLVGGQK